MARAVNDATLQKAGDIYQYLIALKDCFDLADGDTLQIETMWAENLTIRPSPLPLQMWQLMAMDMSLV